MPKTIDDFIKQLQAISADKRKLPSIKMRWDNPLETFSKAPDKMVITWKD